MVSHKLSGSRIEIPRPATSPSHQPQPPAPRLIVISLIDSASEQSQSVSPVTEHLRPRLQTRKVYHLPRPPPQSHPGSLAPKCRYFAAGQCKRRKCRFSHTICLDHRAGICILGLSCPHHHMESTGTDIDNVYRRPKNKCENYALGACPLGPKCRFSHKTCRKFLRGKCKRGNQCRYHHMSPAPPQTLNPESNVPRQHWQRRRQQHNTVNGRQADTLEESTAIIPAHRFERTACDTNIVGSKIRNPKYILGQQISREEDWFTEFKAVGGRDEIAIDHIASVFPKYMCAFLNARPPIAGSATSAARTLAVDNLLLFGITDDRFVTGVQLSVHPAHAPKKDFRDELRKRLDYLRKNLIHPPPPDHLWELHLADVADSAGNRVDGLCIVEVIIRAGWGAHPVYTVSRHGLTSPGGSKYSLQVPYVKCKASVTTLDISELQTRFRDWQYEKSVTPASKS